MSRYGIMRPVVYVQVYYCERGGLCPGMVL